MEKLQCCLFLRCAELTCICLSTNHCRLLSVALRFPTNHRRWILCAEIKQIWCLRLVSQHQSSIYAVWKEAFLLTICLCTTLYDEEEMKQRYHSWHYHQMAPWCCVEMEWVNLNWTDTLSNYCNNSNPSDRKTERESRKSETNQKKTL